MTTSRRLALLAVLTMLLSLSAGIAFAHVERSSYFPNPAPDKSVEPAAGGKVPKARSLESALRSKSRGDTYVVCKSDSLSRAKRSISRAQKSGWSLRPTVAAKKLSKKAAKQLLKINKQLAKRCDFRHIQAAVNEANNNDRVVVMPGEYLEEPSRKQPTNDPKCKRYEERSERGAGAATYRYQVKCPNDQNLIYIQGRALTKKKVPFPPLADRSGIPDQGKCIKCNLQIEGSGRERRRRGDRPRRERQGHEAARPAKPAKDVGFRADRADGVVIRNVTVAHAAEHGIYVHETDGYLLSKFKVFYNKEYGTLTFTSDHGLTADCEGMGHGDSAVYPGAAPETAEQTEEKARRANQEITRCDVHHNTLGYSGTMGNGTRVHHNNFYDNGTAVTTDSFFAGGHPGYPQDGAVFENNKIYSNNFNSYVGRLGRRAARAGARGRRDHDRRRKRERDPQQPHLGQLAARDDAAPRPGLALRRDRGRPATPSPTATATTTTSWDSRRTATACPTGSTSGGTRRRHRRTTAGSTTARLPPTRRRRSCPRTARTPATERATRPS